jgi:hypothetical protein
MEAVNLGVHEFLLKPVSSTALLTRVLGVLTLPRPMVRRGNYYGPEPRRLSSYKPEVDPGVGLVDIERVRNRSPNEQPSFMLFNN